MLLSPGSENHVDFTFSIAQVCDEDVFAEETQKALAALRAVILDMAYEFFSKISRDSLDETQCIFMMETLAVRRVIEVNDV